MTDTRYLVRRYHRWYLQLSVPKGLRERLGKKLIIRPLDTSDLRTARLRRDELLPKIRQTFDELQSTAPPWSAEAVAQDLRAQVQLGQLSPPEADAELAEEVSRRALAAPIPNIVTGAAADDILRAQAVLAQGQRLSEAVRAHLDALQGNVRQQTWTARQRRLADLVQFLGDPPVTEVTRRRLADYVTGPLAASGRSVKTQRDIVGDIGAAFRWLRDAGWIDEHPAQGLAALVRESKLGREEESRRAWTDAELAQLLGHCDELGERDYLPRLVRVGMFSGMRLNEICALRGSDIEEQAFVIRQGKNKNSVRRVPVHSQILPLVDGLGQRDWLIEGLQPGGEDGKRGHEASKRFGRHKSKWGFERALVFHGLRMSFIAKMEAAGVPVTTAELVVGHARQSMSYGHYSRGLPLEQMREAVEAVNYHI